MNARTNLHVGTRHFVSSPQSFPEMRALRLSIDGGRRGMRSDEVSSVARARALGAAASEPHRSRPLRPALHLNVTMPEITARDRIG